MINSDITSLRLNWLFTINARYDKRCRSLSRRSKRALALLVILVLFRKGWLVGCPNILLKVCYSVLSHGCGTWGQLLLDQALQVVWPWLIVFLCFIWVELNLVIIFSGLLASWLRVWHRNIFVFWNLNLSWGIIRATIRRNHSFLICINPNSFQFFGFFCSPCNLQVHFVFFFIFSD